MFFAMPKIAKEREKMTFVREEVEFINLIEERYPAKHSLYSSFQNTTQFL